MTTNSHTDSNYKSENKPLDLNKVREEKSAQNISPYLARIHELLPINNPDMTDYIFEEEIRTIIFDITQSSLSEEELKLLVEPIANLYAQKVRTLIGLSIEKLDS